MVIVLGTYLAIVAILYLAIIRHRKRQRLRDAHTPSQKETAAGLMRKVPDCPPSADPGEMTFPQINFNRKRFKIEDELPERVAEKNAKPSTVDDDLFPGDFDFAWTCPAWMRDLIDDGVFGSAWNADTVQSAIRNQSMQADNVARRRILLERLFVLYKLRERGWL